MGGRVGDMCMHACVVFCNMCEVFGPLGSDRSGMLWCACTASMYVPMLLACLSCRLRHLADARAVEEIMTEKAKSTGAAGSSGGGGTGGGSEPAPSLK